ncbi:MAG TPA: cation diffusion facilitator family transporter [Melioribacteraceae bacterium]|nr:cation diffusion facilitator family transporter [Melioribacteraceae bacterium]
MSHNHKHTTKNITERNLIITMLLNFLITIAELIGGIISGSLALISDALHNFSDGIAVIITFIAIKLSKKPRTYKHTFGFKRAEIIAAIINASTLIIISIYLIKEAIIRFYEPSIVEGNLMIIIAVIGFFANTIGTYLLSSNKKDNINIKAAYLHLFSDAISSLGVIIGALLIIYYKIYWVDPLLTILISIYILKESYFIVKQAIEIIMMFTPNDIDINEITKIIETFNGVKNIHHIHLWKLNDNDTHFEAHVEVEDIKVSQTVIIQKTIEDYLHTNYNIHHSTLQFECGKCSDETDDVI